MTENKTAGRTKRWIVAALCVVFLPIITANFTFFVKGYLHPEHIPDIFGIKPVIATGTDMESAFSQDSIALFGKTDAQELAVGDVICYMQDGIAHSERIEQIVSENGSLAFVTENDAQETASETPVKAAQIEGVLRGSLAGVGSVAVVLQSNLGILLFMICPLSLYLLADIVMRRREEVRTKRRMESELIKLRGQVSAVGLGAE